MDELFIPAIALVLKMERFRDYLRAFIVLLALLAFFAIKMWFQVWLATHYGLERFEADGTVIVPKALDVKSQKLNTTTKKTIRVGSERPPR